MVKNSKYLNAIPYSVNDEERLHCVLDRGFDRPVSEDFDLILRGHICTVSSRFGYDGV